MLGDTCARRIENTSLAKAPEMKALIKVQRVSSEQAEALIQRAEAGEPVSAVAALAALKQEPAPARSQPMPIREEVVGELRVRIGELEDTNKRLELRAIGLESEIAELRATGSSIDRILETLERRIPAGNKAAHQCMRALRETLEQAPTIVEGEYRLLN